MTQAERDALPDRLRARIVMTLGELLLLGGCAVVALTAALWLMAGLVIGIAKILGVAPHIQSRTGSIFLLVAGGLTTIATVLILRAMIAQRLRVRRRLRQYSAVPVALEAQWSERLWFAITYDDVVEDQHTDADEPNTNESDALDFDPDDRELLISPGVNDDWLLIWRTYEEVPVALASHATLVTSEDGYVLLRDEPQGPVIEPLDIACPESDGSEVDGFMDGTRDRPIVQLLAEADVQAEIRDAVLARLDQGIDA